MARAKPKNLTITDLDEIHDFYEKYGISNNVCNSLGCDRCPLQTKCDALPVGTPEFKGKPSTWEVQMDKAIAKVKQVKEYTPKQKEKFWRNVSIVTRTNAFDGKLIENSIHCGGNNDCSKCVSFSGADDCDDEKIFKAWEAYQLFLKAQQVFE